MRRAIPLLAICALFLPACDAGEQPQQDLPARDSAGVTILEHPAEDRPLRLSAVAGSHLVSPDSALTAVPWGTAADPVSGRMFVADRHQDRIVVFDSAGDYLTTLGRSGGGPGEFRNPSAVYFAPDRGVLIVWDTGRGILSRWSRDGEFLGEETAPIAYWGPGFAVDSTRIITVTSTQTEAGMGMEQRLVSIHGDRTATLHRIDVAMNLMELPCIRTPAQKIFTPTVTWTTFDDRTYVHKGPGYRIDVLEGGATVRSIRRDIEPIPVTEAMAARVVESGPTPYRGLLSRCDVTPEQVAAAVGHEESVSPVQHLFVDPAGRLWVTRTSDGITPGVWDLFNPGGVYLGSTPAAGVPVGFSSESKMGVLSLSELGGTVVTLFDLREEPGESATAPIGDAGAHATANATHTAVPGFRDCPRCPEMVELPAGTLRMGSPPGEAPAARISTRPEWTEQAEQPQVEVTLAEPFALGRYEVTFDEWDYCVEQGGCSYTPDDEAWGRDDRPVIHVGRRDAEEYVTWLREHTGRAYRLPTEAEWEYAARGGTTTARHWGDELGTGNAVCDGCGSDWDKKSTAPVGSFAANPFGLHDMLGNVKEWVADCWTPSHADAPTDGSARIEDSPWWKDGECQRPVYRGGTWASYPWTVRAAYRNYYFPGPWGDRDATTGGFRVALTLPGVSPAGDGGDAAGQ